MLPQYSPQFHPFPLYSLNSIINTINTALWWRQCKITTSDIQMKRLHRKLKQQIQMVKMKRKQVSSSAITNLVLQFLVNSIVSVDSDFVSWYHQFLRERPECENYLTLLQWSTMYESYYQSIISVQTYLLTDLSLSMVVENSWIS